MATALLLPLEPSDGYLLVDALVAFANAIEKEDPDTATEADDLAERIRLLRPLLAPECDQLLKSIGLGRYRHRPQG